MKSFGQPDHPFYRPLWRRILIVITTVLWVGFEFFFSHSGLWTVLALAICIYSIWTFLITYRLPD